MIRRFLTATGDNNPQTDRITISPGGTSGTYTVSTGYPVSWIYINGTTVPENSYSGPYYFDPGGSTYTYSVATITGVGGIEYETDSLQIFLNGTLLTRDSDYVETSNEEFTLKITSQVASSILTTLPDSANGDKMSIVFRQIVSDGGSLNVYASSFYPDVEEGFVITYANATSDFTVDVVYM